MVAWVGRVRSLGQHDVLVLGVDHRVDRVLVELLRELLPPCVHLGGAGDHADADQEGCEDDPDLVGTLRKHPPLPEEDERQDRDQQVETCDNEADVRHWDEQAQHGDPEDHAHCPTDVVPCPRPGDVAAETGREAFVDSHDQRDLYAHQETQQARVDELDPTEIIRQLGVGPLQDDRCEPAEDDEHELCRDEQLGQGSFQKLLQESAEAHHREHDADGDRELLDRVAQQVRQHRTEHILVDQAGGTGGEHRQRQDTSRGPPAQTRAAS